MTEIGKLVDQEYFGNTLWQWGVAAGIALAVFFVALIVRRMIRANYDRLAATEQTEFLELPLRIASRTTLLFLLVVALFLAAQALQLSQRPERILQTIVTIAAFWQVGVWATAAIIAWLDHKQRRSMEVNRAAVGTIGILGFIARALIWSLVALLTLDNLGINITALVAGLGIGGIAVALAVQNVLGDLLASLSITLDRPFVVGDAVSVGEVTGTVEQIGVKSVRIRSVTGEQIIMPNADMLASRVRNFGRMRERRIVFTIGVIHETPRTTLERIPGLLRSIIEAQQEVRFDRCHLARLGAASLDFEAVYFVLTADYTRYMDVQQSINYALIEAFERDGIEFAYPTQKLWLQTIESDKLAAQA